MEQNQYQKRSIIEFISRCCNPISSLSVNTLSARLIRSLYGQCTKKGTGNDKQGKDAGNRTLCPHRNFSQAIITASYLIFIITLKLC